MQDNNHYSENIWLEDSKYPTIYEMHFKKHLKKQRTIRVEKKFSIQNYLLKYK